MQAGRHAHLSAGEKERKTPKKVESHYEQRAGVRGYIIALPLLSLLLFLSSLAVSFGGRKH